jgi:hypothetical protein
VGKSAIAGIFQKKKLNNIKKFQQTAKVWLHDGTKGDYLKCAPDSNGIIGRQFQPGNPDNRAGSNIIERRRNVIQMIQV